MDAFVRQDITPLTSVVLTEEHLPPTLEGAYQRVRAVTNADPKFGAAWKLGGSTPAAQEKLGIDQFFFAPLHESEIVKLDGKVPGFEVLQLKAEAEIALRIGNSAASYLEKGMDALLDAPLHVLFDAWAVALEMPSSSLVNGADFGVRAAVLDRCAAGSLLLGPMNVYGENTIWLGEVLRLEQDGEEISSGTTKDLVASPDKCAREFLGLASKLGFKPQPGQWITTGGMSPCVELEKGAAIELFYDECSVMTFCAGW